MQYQGHKKRQWKGDLV